MKNRKMLLAALFSIALVFSLILPASAAGASAAVQASGSVIFDDQFSDPTLNADWVISPGKGNYSLTDNPGYLRYIIDAYGWSSGGGAVPLQLRRPFSGDQWVLRTAITYNMRPAEPTNNRNMHFGILAPNGTSMVYVVRSVGVDDTNPASNVMSLSAGSNAQNIYFPNSPDPLPLERWYFEIVRNKDYVAVMASNDGNDSTFEYEVGYTFPSGVLGNGQHALIQATGWYGSNDPPGYADFDFISSTSTSEVGVIKYALPISSTGGGSVTEPGEGAFTYDKGTVVDLVATSDTGYQFVNWTGDVDTIADVYAAATNITMDDNYSVTANFVSVEAGNVGIKTGDWIKVEYRITGLPAGQSYPEWLKLEFLSVEGTSANVRVTLHWSDGTEQSDTAPVDVVSGGEVPGLSGGIISANLTTGDSVYMSGFGDVAIEGETTRTYAGARRTVVYASFSQYGVQLTYYWDKLTGVMVGGSITYGGMTVAAKATETNMWEAGPPAAGMAWWLWIIVAVVVVALAIVVYRLKKRKTPTAPTLPTEGT